jgi:hypothetical protein
MNLLQYPFIKGGNKTGLQVTARIMSRKEALSQFIQQIHGRPVVVKLNSGVDYRGENDFCQKLWSANRYKMYCEIILQKKKKIVVPICERSCRS